MGATDALLLEGLRTGDIASFEAIFQQHYPSVRRVLQRMLRDSGEAEEVAQEVFLKLYQEPLPAHRVHNLGAWLYRVATRLGYNALRTRRRSSARDAVWQAVNTHCESPAEEQAIHAEEQSQVRQALASLSARDAQLLVLRHSGLSYQECAEVLEVAVTSIGTLLARAERAFEKRYVALDRGKEHGHGTSG